MILITGCAGFIGFHVSNFYLSKGVKILGIDNLNNYYKVSNKKKRLNILSKKKNFKFIKFDLKNEFSYKKLNKYKKNIKFIIHFAGQAGVRYSFENPNSYIKNNIQAYINLLEYFKHQSNLKGILYASSSSVYGDKSKKHEKNYNMISIYAVSKKALEHISKVYNRVYKLNFIGLRFFTVYGPYGRPDMSYFKFFKNISLNKPIEIYNYGNHSRSFTYITDVVENLDKIIVHIKNSPRKYFCDVINMGNPKSVKLNYLINLVEKFCKRTSKKKFLPLQLGDVKKTKASTKKNSKKFGFKYKVELEEGIKKFSNWFFNEKNK